MTIEQSVFYIQGYKDVYTTYTIGYENISFGGETVAVKVTTLREGDSAIIDDSYFRLYVNGSLVAEDLHSPRRFTDTLTLSAPASQGDGVTVRFNDESGWDADDYAGDISDAGIVEFTDTVPHPPFDSTAVTASCTLSDQSVIADESATVNTTVQNQNNVDASATVAASAGATTVGTQTTTVPANSSKTLTYSFVPRDVGLSGDSVYDVSASVTDATRA